MNVAADKRIMRIEISEDGIPKAWIEATAPEVDSLISSFANLRAGMVPEVSRQLPQGDAAMKGPYDPLFGVYDAPVIPARILAIRHDGLGWLSFVFLENEAKKIAGEFQRPLVSQTLPPTQTHQ